MALYKAVFDFVATPKVRSNLGLMSAGFAAHLVGALLLENRIVALVGWLVAVFAAVNYLRAIKRRMCERAPQAKEPWQE